MKPVQASPASVVRPHTEQEYYGMVFSVFQDGYPFTTLHSRDIPKFVGCCVNTIQKRFRSSTMKEGKNSCTLLEVW